MVEEDREEIIFLIGFSLLLTGMGSFCLWVMV